MFRLANKKAASVTHQSTLTLALSQIHCQLCPCDYLGGMLANKGLTFTCRGWGGSSESSKTELLNVLFNASCHLQEATVENKA